MSVASSPATSASVGVRLMVKLSSGIAVSDAGDGHALDRPQLMGVTRKKWLPFDLLKTAGVTGDWTARFAAGVR
jgi:hypothetical protein